ncbi:MAG: hypothetical protein HY916_09225 [Desulfovibrio sp.]|jgi:hypothetical protein|nr:hypothetical protein [Desulfovibrio sp.]
MHIMNGTVEMQDVGLLVMAGLLALLAGDVLIAAICGALAGDSIQRLVWLPHWPAVSGQAAIATRHMKERQKADEAEARRVHEATEAKPQDSSAGGEQPTFKLAKPGQWCATEHGKDGDTARIIRAADEAEARRICREKGLRFDGRLVCVARGLNDADVQRLVRELGLRDSLGVRGRQ